MNRDILTGSEAISAHYYTIMSHDHRGVTWERRLARSTRSYIGTAVERAVEDNITCSSNIYTFVIFIYIVQEKSYLELRCIIANSV